MCMYIYIYIYIYSIVIMRIFTVTCTYEYLTFNLQMDYRQLCPRHVKKKSRGTPCVMLITSKP